MDRARLHEGLRRMRFTDVPGRCERSELSQMEAGELLGISERTFRRWRDRHRESGLEGLSDRRLASSLRRASVAEIERMLGLYRELYRGFTMKHVHEHLVKRHNYVLGYTVTKLHLQREGLVQGPRRARCIARSSRPGRGINPISTTYPDANARLGLPRYSGGSASMTSLSRPAQALLTLRPAGLLNRPRRPLS
jgi:transposase